MALFKLAMRSPAEYVLHALAKWLQPYIDARFRDLRISEYIVFGAEHSRLRIHPTARVWNALFNVASGSITIEENVFFGHNVTILTGTHDYHQQGTARCVAVPSSGNDVIIERGAWVASNSTIIGPCRIGRSSVVAAGAVVTRDVKPLTVVAGIPARELKRIVD
jgi:acetyltransferase-like isoleucine patch superfamily enzyme